jgi:hypothetical protein
MDELIDRAAAEFAREIDQQILEEIEKEGLMEEGWVKAPFTTDKFSWPFKHILEEVVAWIHVNHTDEYQVFGKEFWFKSPSDLTAFILKWS